MLIELRLQQRRQRRLADRHLPTRAQPRDQRAARRFDRRAIARRLGCVGAQEEPSGVAIVGRHAIERTSHRQPLRTLLRLPTVPAAPTLLAPLHRATRRQRLAQRHDQVVARRLPDDQRKHRRARAHGGGGRRCRRRGRAVVVGGGGAAATAAAAVGAGGRLGAVKGDEVHDAPLVIAEAARRRVPYLAVVPHAAVARLPPERVHELRLDGAPHQAVQVVPRLLGAQHHRVLVGTLVVGVARRDLERLDAPRVRHQREAARRLVGPHERQPQRAARLAAAAAIAVAAVVQRRLDVGTADAAQPVLGHRALGKTLERVRRVHDRRAQRAAALERRQQRKRRCAGAEGGRACRAADPRAVAVVDVEEAQPAVLGGGRLDAAHADRAARQPARTRRRARPHGAVDVPLQRSAADDLRAARVAVGGARAAERARETPVVAQLALADHQHLPAVRQLERAGRAHSLGLVALPRVCRLIAPDREVLARIEPAQQRHEGVWVDVRRRGALEHQQPVLGERLGEQLHLGLVEWCREVEAAHGSAELQLLATWADRLYGEAGWREEDAGEHGRRHG